MNKITKNIAALIAFGIGTTTIGFAQVTQQKIGNNPTLINPNAALEVESTTKGLLLPRLGLSATNSFSPLTAHVAGMTVYNTATSDVLVAEENKVTPGYYYNDGTQWVRVATGADAKTEPWFIQGTTDEATGNAQNIYQSGSVAIKKDQVYGNAALDVEGAVRGGTNQQGNVGTNSVAFGSGNVASEQLSVVSGGQDNINHSNHGVIGGGQENQLINNGGGPQVGPNYATIGGGQGNQVLGIGVIGGLNGTIGGGQGNKVSERYATVSGGQENEASAEHSTVSGGSQNKVSGSYATISGGQENEASAEYSIISGGYQNKTSETYATISGGASNEASGSTSFIGGGTGNIASGYVSLVSGGAYNQATAQRSTIGGGANNQATALNATVGGGGGNIASGVSAVVGGGAGNEASGDGTTIAGGDTNQASGLFSTISGGHTNVASGDYSSVSGGIGNIAASFREWVGGSYGTEYTPVSVDDWNDADRLLNIGKGLGGGLANHRRDAFTILKNNKTGIGFDNFETTTFDQMLQVNGNARFVTLPSVTGNATDRIVVTNADGVLRTIAASSVGGTEPWRIQGGTTQATTNAQNIYQTGNVAVGDFSGAASTKKMEVKGDFKAQVTDGNIIYGTEVNSPLGTQLTGNYWMDTTTGAYRVAVVRPDAAILEANGITTSSIFNAEDDHATMASLQKNDNAKSEIRTENDGNFFMESFNVTDNFSSTFSLQNDAVRLVHTNNGGTGVNFLSPNNRSEIMVQKTNGVRFDFRNATGGTTGSYWFPLTTGTAGQVMTQSGTGGRIEWRSPSTFGAANNGLTKNATNGDFELGGTLNRTTTIATVNGATTHPLNITGLPTGIATDNIVVSSTGGQLKTITTANLVREPWNVIGSSPAVQATNNTDNIYQMGNVSIGKSTATSFTIGTAPAQQTINPKLHVEGDISTTGKIWTTNSVYADYVFEKYFIGNSEINPNYEFKSLNYVKEFIKANNHLPGVESIADLSKAENGYTFDITKLTVQSLEKIEELYLHTIEQQDKIDQQQSEIEKLKKDAEETKNRLEKLEKFFF